MKTIKIIRISGEFRNKDGEVSEYINPKTKYSPLDWHPYKRGKKIFDSIDFETLLIDDDCSRGKKEFHILDNDMEGFEPMIYLFSFDIPEYIWKNKEKFAKELGYDDSMEYITYFTDYNWKLEQEKVIEIPAHLTEMFENFLWIETNKDKLQLKYMQFLVETGGEENLTQLDFYLYMAKDKDGREIVEMDL